MVLQTCTIAWSRLHLEPSYKATLKLILKFFSSRRQIIEGWYRRKPDTKEPTAWNKYSCCLPRQDCSDRTSWVIMRNTTGLPESMKMAAAGSSGFAKPPPRKQKMLRGAGSGAVAAKGDYNSNDRIADGAAGYEEEAQVLPELMNIFGLQIGLGNSNFHKDLYRACTLSDLKQQCKG